MLQDIEGVQQVKREALSGKTVLMTGGSRGIGLAIACRLARDGANIAILAKTAEPHPKLPGTIYTAAAAIEESGGRALPLAVDVRDAAAIEAAVQCTAETFGGIDACIHNAGAISRTGTLETGLKQYDLMSQINQRALYALVQSALPFLFLSRNPHVLSLSPPVDLDVRWLAAHAAYTVSKYTMSLYVRGMAEEFRDRGVAFNALWPISSIDTSAVRFTPDGAERSRASRTPEIMADAAWTVLTSDSRSLTGQLLLDELVLREAGVSDFENYAVTPGEPLRPDLFVAQSTLDSVPTRFAPSQHLQ